MEYLDLIIIIYKIQIFQIFKFKKNNKEIIKECLIFIIKQLNNSQQKVF